MNCSVIICTRNRPKDLERCLNSLAQQTFMPQEVIVVDGSDEENILKEMLKEEKYLGLNIRLIHTMPGLTRQRNIGVERASGDVIFFFDDDVCLDKRYIEMTVKVYNDKRLKNVGGVQGMDLNSDVSFLEGKRRLFFYRMFFLKRRDKYQKLLPSGNVVHLDMASPEVEHTNIPIPVKCMSGCMMSYKRNVFDEFKFDDFGFTGYSHGEDAEFSHRVSGKYCMYFTSQAKIYHNQSSEKKEWYKNEGFVRSDIQGQVYRFRKLLRNNPLNYIAILWSWAGILIWDGFMHPNKIYFLGYLKVMKEEFLNLFKPVKNK